MTDTTRTLGDGAALAQALTVEIIDQAVHYGRGRWSVERVVQAHTGEKILVKVSRNLYASESYATASVLAPDRTWVRLCGATPRYWHDGTPGEPKHDEAAITGAGWLIDELVARALKILDVPPADPVKVALAGERKAAAGNLRRILSQYPVDDVHGLTRALEEYADRLEQTG